MLGSTKPDFAITERLPDGWRIDVYNKRRQPFTVWDPKGEVAGFTVTRRSAMAVVRAG